MIFLRSVGLGLALLVVGRVHVGGLGRELGGAGVDALVDRAHAERVRRCAHRVLVGAEQLAPGGDRRSPWPSGSAARPPSRLASVAAGERAARSATISSICARNHGSIAVSSKISSSVMPMRKRVGDEEDALGAGLADLAGRSPRGRCVRLVEAVDARSRGRAAPSGGSPGTCGRSPSPRRPTSSASSGASRRPGTSRTRSAGSW